MMRDDGGAFCPEDDVRLPGTPGGPLAGMRFAAKDLFDVAGYVTGCGNPDWRRSHAPAPQTAPAVRALLDAGAELVGKTVCDELAFSLSGRNLHYGTPANPAAPGRIPGGSSSGSASAVAAGLVDFALGTDTGGSVRVPAALCGVLGFRPSHGAVSLQGVMPFAPSFDTVGWFAPDAGVLRRAGEALLPAAASGGAGGPWIVLEDAFAIADPHVARAVREAVERLEPATGPARATSLGEVEFDPASGREIFRTLQGCEVWQAHGSWIESVRPRLGIGVAARFTWAKTVTPEASAEAATAREAFARRLDELLAGGAVLCLPTAATVAPPVDADPETLGDYRRRTLSLTCLAGLAGLPQLALPAGLAPAEDGAGPYPVGLSLIARRGADRALLELAERLMPLLSR